MTVPGSNHDPWLRSGASAAEALIPYARAEQPRDIDRLVALVYELLDAHRDTEELMTRLDLGVTWQAHLDYLRSLRRTGHEVLACSVQEERS
jgi:hypothetical protein